MRAFRNVAVHQYFAVECAEVWALATVNVPVLRTQVLDVLHAEYPDVASRVKGSAG